MSFVIATNLQIGVAISTVIWGAGDEARLHFSLQCKEKLLFGSFKPSPLTCHRQVRTYFRAVVTADKNKRPSVRMVFVFMERVTRLELATSTLARWRSTG